MVCGDESPHSKNGKSRPKNLPKINALLSKVDKASTVPFDSLPVLAVCDTTYSSLVQIRGCTTLTTVSVRVKQIRVVVTTSFWS